jgi:hypothetical protein
MFSQIVKKRTVVKTLPRKLRPTNSLSRRVAVRRYSFGMLESGGPPGEGERIWFVADTLTLKATAASTGRSFTVVECLTAPGDGALDRPSPMLKTYRR